MRYRNPALIFLLPFASIVFAALLFVSNNSVTSQPRPKQKNTNSNLSESVSTPTPPVADVVKVDVDLVKVDALVLEKKTARAVGGLKKDDFLIYEDGARTSHTLVRIACRCR